MDAQVVAVDGLGMGPSETYPLGKDLDGSMDVVHAGIWDIVQELVQLFHHIRQLVIYRVYKIRKIFLRDNSRVFRTVLRTSRSDCQRFKNKSKISAGRDKRVVH